MYQGSCMALRYEEEKIRKTYLVSRNPPLNSSSRYGGTRSGLMVARETDSVEAKCKTRKKPSTILIEGGQVYVSLSTLWESMPSSIRILF